MNTKTSNRITISRFFDIVLKQKALIAITFMFVLMLFFETNFYTAYNLLDILNSASINMILAVGVTLVLICGGCDFSIGGMLSLSGILTIKMMEIMPIIPAMLVSIAIGEHEEEEEEVTTAEDIVVANITANNENSENE